MTMLAVFVSLALLLSTLADAQNIWDISIFEGPAPAPDEGPPLSASADRNPADLKFEVIGIIAAIVAWTLVTILAIYVVGRRQRRKSSRSNQRFDIKMQQLKPMGGVTVREIDPPLKSPGKFSLRSWKKGHKERGSEVSFSTIDTRVVETDRMHNMDDLTKLYAAVMAHDEEKSIASKSVDNSPTMYAPPTPRTPKSPAMPQEHFPPHYRPPIPQYATHFQQAEPQYPADFQQSGPELGPEPQSPRFPQDYQQQEIYQQRYLPCLAEQPEQALPLSDHDEQALLGAQASPRKHKPSAISVSSVGSRVGSPPSQKARPSPITVNGRPISKPLGSATLSSAQTPTAALYNPGPPPPTPGRKAGVTTSIADLTCDPAPTYDPIVPATRSKGTGSLPFRQYQNTDSLLSAPPTKTTFLDRRVSALNGPRTGVPMTPYSPYQPKTPMTPITPRTFLTKQQLKEARKNYNLKAVNENDIVQSEDEMWGTVG